MFQSTTYGSSRVPDPGYEESSVKAGTPLTSTSFFSRHLVLSSCSAQVRCDIGEVRPTTSWCHADNYTWSFYRFQVLGDFVGEQADGREFTLDTVTIAWWLSESAFILPASWVPEKPEPPAYRRARMPTFEQCSKCRKPVQPTISWTYTSTVDVFFAILFC